MHKCPSFFCSASVTHRPIKAAGKSTEQLNPTLSKKEVEYLFHSKILVHKTEISIHSRDEQTFWNCFGLVLVLSFGIGFGIVYAMFKDLVLGLFMQ